MDTTLTPATIDQQEAVLNSGNLEIQLRKDPKVIELSQKIDVKNQLSLLEYGKEPATEISNFSGRILNSIKSNSVEESSVLIQQLNKIMDKFDSNDFAEKPGLLAKLFGKGGNIVEKLFQKYNTMGSEIDKIYAEIMKYESQMKSSTSTLEQMYDQNFQFYSELQKYIIAGQMKAEQLKTEVLPDLEKRAAAGDQIAAMDLASLRNGIELIEQRCYDLEMAKQVSFQTAPQIRMLQKGNTNLIAKINSAFVTTIPIFKSGIINAISAKRQKLVADSMSELDKRTNEMLVRNAQTISTQAVDIARLSGQPSIKVETIEQTWNVIMKGVQDTKNIEEENKRLREDGIKRLEALKENIDQLRLGTTIAK